MAPSYHILHRLQPLGGSQWYRDRRERPAPGTLCGADRTRRDVAFAWSATPWTDDQGVDHVPCPTCVEERRRLRAARAGARN